jgi:hypothetical protein
VHKGVRRGRKPGEDGLSGDDAWAVQTSSPRGDLDTAGEVGFMGLPSRNRHPTEDHHLTSVYAPVVLVLRRLGNARGGAINVELRGIVRCPSMSHPKEVWHGERYHRSL